MLTPIYNSDLEGKGVTPLSDIPGLSAEEMKYKFEQILREVVIVKFNAAIEELNSQIFVNPEGVEYLTVNNLITSYDAIPSVTDPKKIPSATAIATMISNMNAEIATLKAALAKKYIVFRANGGTGTMNQVEYSAGMKLPQNTFTKANGSFQGWATAEGGTVVYADKATISAIAANCGSNVLELFAVWG